ncbi:hypothetical protein LINPERPRIM_LOCUS22022, partial [Linum perenne]
MKPSLTLEEYFNQFIRLVENKREKQLERDFEMLYVESINRSQIPRQLNSITACQGLHHLFSKDGLKNMDKPCHIVCSRSDQTMKVRGGSMYSNDKW